MICNLQELLIFSKRNLKLELTDGSKTVHAMEYKPIPCLSTKLAPGTKILLIGPIKVVNKILFLEPKNVQVLGGEVDTLLILNAYENVLLKLLNKPTTAKPKLDYKEDAVTVEQDRRRNIQPVPMSQSRFKQKNTQQFKRPPQPPVQNNHLNLMGEEDDFLLDINLDNLPGMSATSTQKPVPKTVQNPIDAFKNEDDMDYILAETVQTTDARIPNTDPPKPQIQLDVDMTEIMTTENLPPIDNPDVAFEDDDLLAQVNIDIPVDSGVFTASANTNTAESSRNSSNSKETPTNSRNQISPVIVGNSPLRPTNPGNLEKTSNNSLITTSNKSSSQNSIKRFSQGNEASSSSSNQVVISPESQYFKVCDAEYPFKIGNTNLSTIDQINQLSVQEKLNKYFVVCSGIKQFWRGLKVKDGEWKLRCVLQDDYSSSELNVKISSQVIAKLTGYEADEFEKMNQNAKSKPQLKDQMREVS